MAACPGAHTYRRAAMSVTDPSAKLVGRRMGYASSARFAAA